jgi:hypothetical protein
LAHDLEMSRVFKVFVCCHPPRSRALTSNDEQSKIGDACTVHALAPFIH